MESLIDSILKSKVHDFKKSFYEKNKKEFIDKTILTINAIENLHDFQSLIDLVYGIFTYMYTNIEGSLFYGTSRVHPSLDKANIFTLAWYIDKKQHNYLTLINKNARILTYDSVEATKYNKAGILGVMEGKNIIHLENYIRDKCNDKFIMWSSPVISDSKELEKIQDIVSKYKIKGPIYVIDYSYDKINEKRVFENGYIDGYCGKIENMISYDTIIDTFCEFDVDILKAGRISLTSTRKNLLKSIKKENLYKVSFLGSKMNDNSLFKLLSEFEITYFN